MTRACKVYNSLEHCDHLEGDQCSYEVDFQTLCEKFGAEGSALHDGVFVCVKALASTEGLCTQQSGNDSIYYLDGDGEHCSELQLAQGVTYSEGLIQTTVSSPQSSSATDEARTVTTILIPIVLAIGATAGIGGCVYCKKRKPENISGSFAGWLIIFGLFRRLADHF